MVELTLVRHAPTRLNEARRFQGWSDPGLSPAGRARARRLARVVALGAAPDAVVASDLRRAWRTAEILLPGAPVARDPRLRELGFGAFEGATWDENRARHGAAFDAWAADPDRRSPPEGESLPELRRRVGAWLEELPPAGRLLVVTHGGTLGVILARCLALPARWDVERRLVPAPCAVARVAWKRRA